MSSAVRAEKIAREVDDAARQLAQAGRLDLTHEFIQHGDVTVYAQRTQAKRAGPVQTDASMQIKRQVRVIPKASACCLFQ